MSWFTFSDWYGRGQPRREYEICKYNSSHPLSVKRDCCKHFRKDSKSCCFISLIVCSFSAMWALRMKVRRCLSLVISSGGISKRIEICLEFETFCGCLLWRTIFGSIHAALDPMSLKWVRHFSPDLVCVCCVLFVLCVWCCLFVFLFAPTVLFCPSLIFDFNRIKTTITSPPRWRDFIMGSLNLDFAAPCRHFCYGVPKEPCLLQARSFILPGWRIVLYMLFKSKLNLFLSCGFCDNTQFLYHLIYF